MKKFLIVLALVFGATPLWAQIQQKAALLAYNYDLASTSYIYCTYLGKGGDPWGQAGGNVSPANVVTSGSSTTVAALTASTNPFAQVAVNDLLVFRIPGTGTNYQRRVTARASADSITVDTAIDLGTTGVPFTWYRATCGTAASDGWLDVSQFFNLTFVRSVATINATSLDFQIECRLNNVPGAAIIEDSESATTTGINSVVITAGAWDACRYGMKVDTDGGAQSVTLAVSYNR